MSLATSPRRHCDAAGCKASTSKESPLASDFAHFSLTYVTSASDSGVVEKDFCPKHAPEVEKTLADLGFVHEVVLPDDEG